MDKLEYAHPLFLSLFLYTCNSESESPRAQDDVQQQLADWEDRLAMYIYQLVGQRRIAQFFDIVVEHPDSLPAIADLTICLRYTNMHHKFAAQFRKAMQDRLLHAGMQLPILNPPCDCSAS